MERVLKLNINLQDFSVSKEGDTEFFYGDTNKIVTTLENKDENKDYSVVLAGLVPALGTRICEFTKVDDVYVIDNDNHDIDAFIQKIGTINCNIKIYCDDDVITTFPIFFTSVHSYGNDGNTVLTPTPLKTLVDLDMAVKRAEQLDPDTISQEIFEECKKYIDDEILGGEF